ncbi:hypothetical protein ANME2D_02702 [Candidatus Methanoperedens nitroreducens]|uniref:DUF2240 family protein n=1 Tax=Candidatus Methanoperedens nitratireducens TaxID=1392998 RepID=A0A062V4C5_9EURY|nr:DUF2240 family protein [Candidatus Methanoperedens nitroreducens]KCZ70679.1 hypothetical protein ANME2D_02702 [Candidatus Methanoperedens nitroreducens]MDJ1420532.1 DUF2240 family protein [Candidatus Methanoperedens sp.]
MSDLIYSVSVPFKRKGKEVLKESEFILVLAIDLNWFNPEEAKNILNHAQRAGLVKRDGEIVTPAFDISSVEIPPGFRPGSDILLKNLEKKTLFDRIIERIIAGTGMEKRKVISLINKKQEELSKLVEIEVSAILVALEHGVAVNDLLEEEYEALVSPR